MSLVKNFIRTFVLFYSADLEFSSYYLICRSFVSIAFNRTFSKFPQFLFKTLLKTNDLRHFNCFLSG